MSEIREQLDAEEDASKRSALEYELQGRQEGLDSLIDKFAVRACVRCAWGRI